jgi:hypothetical protein
MKWIKFRFIMPKHLTNKKEVLQQARKYIARGWTKGKFEYGLNFCALGAVRHTTRTEQTTWNLYTETINYLDDMCRKLNGTDIVSFNDRPSTRKKDVLNLFDYCIEHAEAA